MKHTFCLELSWSIWDEADIDLLMSAKRGELQVAGIPNPYRSHFKGASEEQGQGGQNTQQAS